MNVDILSFSGPKCGVLENMLETQKAPNVDFWTSASKRLFENVCFRTFMFQNACFRTYSEAEIEDMWHPDEVQAELSEAWVGETRFTLMRRMAKPGYEWQDGRETRVQNTKYDLSHLSIEFFTHQADNIVEKHQPSFSDHLMSEYNLNTHQREARKMLRQNGLTSREKCRAISS